MTQQKTKHAKGAIAAVDVTHPHFLRRFLRKCWMPLALLIVTLAIIFSLFRALTPWAKEYKSEVEHHLSSMLGQPVKINDMETSWYWFVPVLKLNDVTISDSQEHVLQLKKLLVGINLFGSLWHWQVQPGILYVEDAELTIHQVGNQWEIDGLTQEEKMMTLAPTAYIPVLAWLLEQQKIVIKHVSADVYLNDGSFIPLKNINLTVANHHGHYRLKGGAKLLQATPTELLILGDMQINPQAFNKIKGHIYLSLHHFMPIQWKSFIPKLPIELTDGTGDLELWLDFLKGKLNGVQSKLAFQNVVWHQSDKSTQQFIQSIRANLAWSNLSDGWILTGDHIVLQANGFMWPENVLSIQYKQADDAYQIFAKRLLLAPMFKTDIAWPESMHTLRAMHPIGELSDTQIHIHQGNMDYILTRFSNLTWKKYKNTPGVSHVSGVLYWQPMEGRLELDGKEVSIISQDRPKITFEQLNGALDWKDNNEALSLNVERFVLVHPSLTVSAQGALDNYTKTNPGKLRLSLDFSARGVEQWMPYLPSHALKPKLYEWLTHDVKRMDKVVGQMIINGALADFPFDHKEGEFSVNTYITGLDLRFAKYWPVTKNIDAYLRVNHRALEADIIHADFKQVESNRVHLIVPDLGLNHERLLVHGQIDGSGKEMMNYVFSTPLRLQLKKLSSIEIKGKLGLDLSLDVPLFPQDDQILVKGMLTFDKNQLVFKKLSSGITLDALSGVLHFNERGSTNSKLTGILLDAPVSIDVKPVQKPKRYTEIVLETNPSMKEIRKTFDLPILKFIHGHLKLKSIIDLSGDPRQSDHIRVTSPLKGVSIDLPEPFGKEASVEAPLSLDVAFIAEDAFRLRFNYDNKLSSDLWINELNGKVAIDRGELCLGSGSAKLTKTKGVSVTGTLADFQWQKWKPVFASMPVDSNMPNLIDSMRFVDIKLGHLKMFDQDFKEMSVSFNKESKESWFIKLKQHDIACQLHYKPLTNMLTGHFDYLYLNQSTIASKKQDLTPSSLTPKDIPQLNITIDEFKMGEKQIGQLMLKSTSSDTKWLLEQLDISSPAYHLLVKGDWKKSDKVNQTSMQAQVAIKDLAKGLERFQISPAVDARQGSVEFEGGWSGALNDFSLGKLKGQFQMSLKDGRITHLSPETEQKLGLGKLLSILSLQTIPRRLKLDFSDLSHEGYSFDVFKGSFSINNGILNTSDSYLDGPVAYASMKGDLDVSKRLYNLNLQVSPYIGASLPVVATIAGGGPIAGIATWVVVKIINDRMQKVSGYMYKISGSWNDPVIEPVIFHKKTPLRD